MSERTEIQPALRERTRARAAPPHIAATALLLGAWALLIAADMWTWSWLVLLLFFAAFCLLLPLRSAAVLAVAGLALHFGLQVANEYKTALTSMPITFLDLRITAQDSAVLWYLFDLPQWTRHALLGLFATALVLVVVRAASRLRVGLGARSVLAMIIFAGALTGLVAFEAKLSKDVGAHLSGTVPPVHRQGYRIETWRPEGLAGVATHLGPFPFLLYSWFLERQSRPLFFDAEISRMSGVPTYSTEPAQAASSPGAGQLPNIVLVQLESIFNPNWAFNLDREFRSFLFESNEWSHLIAPMRVNIVGGGSWVTEFEILTGLDSRLFGYAGFYTHPAVGVRLDSGLPAFLRAKGFKTTAFYPATGAFFGARKAYTKYGFSSFLDSQDLRLSHPWSASDPEMAEAFLKRSSAHSDGPFFAFIVTNGAHSPYACKNFQSNDQFQVRFRDTADFERTCVLNEYLRLVGQAEQAVKRILQRLLQVREATGRPFVLAVYGDHQPHSLTGGGYGDLLSFDELRTVAPKRQTFLHVLSSLPRPSGNPSGELPASILPTVLSAYVSTDGGSLYMPWNLAAFEACGADLFPYLRSPGQFGMSQTSLKDSAATGRQAGEGDAQCRAIQGPILRQVRDAVRLGSV